MTETNTTIESGDENDEQINRVRESYIEGDVEDAELEDRLERALENGPPVGNGPFSRKSQSLSMMQKLGVWFRFAFLGPILKYQDRRKESVEIDYNWRGNWVRGVDHDPDADDHPAESAGGMQSAFKFAPGIYYILIGMACGFFTAGASPMIELTGLLIMVPLLAMGQLAVQAPAPTVEVTDKGIGTHVAD